MPLINIDHFYGFNANRTSQMWLERTSHETLSNANEWRKENKKKHPRENKEETEQRAKRNHCWRCFIVVVDML